MRSPSGADNFLQLSPETPVPKATRSSMSSPDLGPGGVRPRDNRADEAFVQLLTGEQFRLLRYITVLLGDPHAASNVLQETNVAIWRKADVFEPGTNFRAWAKKIAYWQVQAYVRDKGRERLVFSDQLMEELASREDAEDPREVEVRLALRHCLRKVSEKNRELLRLRYEEARPVAALAESLGKSQSAIKVGLMRIRRALFDCIERKMADSR